MTPTLVARLLASYCTERGESPGVWIGSGMEGIDGLDVGDPVMAEQMPALFGCGLHLLAELRLPQLESADLTGRDFQNVMRLGAPFKIIEDATPFRVEVAQRIVALNAAIGDPVDASVAAADPARIRTQVAREFFVAEHGRPPIDAAELAGQIAKNSPSSGANNRQLRPDVLAGEVGLDAVGGRRTGGGADNRTGPKPPYTTLWRSSSSMLCSTHRT